MWSFLSSRANSVWENKEVKERLPIYKKIFTGECLPRYQLAKLFHTPVKKDKQSNLEIHKKYQMQFKKWVKENQHLSHEEVEKKALKLHSLEELEQNNYLHLKSKIFYDILTECEFCGNKCHVDRTAGQVGKCLIDDQAYVSSSFIHVGEESPIIPSGTIFFYGCTIQCVFCQNWEISQEHNIQSYKGRGINAEGLVRIYDDLRKQGARNINFVGGEPTPNLHLIVESLLKTDIDIPMLWNSNMYLSKTSMDLIVDIFDIWLPDIKYGNDDCGKKYSLVQRYWQVIKRNVKMIEEKGSGEYIIRHLVMPTHVDCCSLPILNWIDENLETPLVNIMGQYRPQYKVRKDSKYQKINTFPTSKEMTKVRNYAEEKGIYWKSVS